MRTPLARSLRRVRTLLLPAVLLLPAACTSAEKRLEQGMRLEQEGRSADAAARYIDALKKDPSLADARLRLQETGARIVASSLDQSSRLESAGRLDDAVTALFGAERMRRSAAEVGVGLDLPAGFTDRRRALLDRAIDDALATSRTLSQGARHDEADARLGRAMTRYAPSPEQRDRLAEARVETSVAAAEAEMAGGRYLAAYQRVARLRQALGGTTGLSRWLDPALRLQEEAQRLGTRSVAVLPATVEQGQRDRLPEEFAPALSDALAAGSWRSPPLFVEVMDPARTWGAVRGRGRERRALSRYEAAQIGRELGADVVVLAVVDSVARWEADVLRTRRAARTGAGADTAFTAVEGRDRVLVRVRWTLMDTGERGLLAQGDVVAQSSTGFRRAEYRGNPAELELSRADRELFDRDGRRGAIGREPMRELVEELSSEVAQRVFAHVQGQIR